MPASPWVQHYLIDYQTKLHAHFVSQREGPPPVQTSQQVEEAIANLAKSGVVATKDKLDAVLSKVRKSIQPDEYESPLVII